MKKFIFKHAAFLELLEQKEKQCAGIFFQKSQSVKEIEKNISETEKKIKQISFSSENLISLEELKIQNNFLNRLNLNIQRLKNIQKKAIRYQSRAYQDYLESRKKVKSFERLREIQKIEFNKTYNKKQQKNMDDIISTYIAYQSKNKAKNQEEC